jgi:predicted amidophosphoribosyltransferase
MERCPLCRATLNGAETCRRCRAELQTVQNVAFEAQTLVGAAMHHLLLDDPATATQLLQRALLYHAAPEVRALLQLVLAQQGGVALEAADTIDDDVADCRCVDLP